MSENQKIIAVCGATGAQGGSVVEYLKLRTPFLVRGLTRKTDSEKAQNLRDAGVEVVQADFQNVESLKKAFEGCHGVFGMTNYWEKADRAYDIAEGKRIVDAAKAVGVKHFVWSSVARPPDGLDVSHWDSKCQVNDYLIASGMSYTTLNTAFYFENFFLFDWFKLKRTSVDREYVADWPFLWSDGIIGAYSVKETGIYAQEIFSNPDKWIGKTMFVVPATFTPRDLVKALNDYFSHVNEESRVQVELTETSRERFDAMRAYSEELWANNEAFYRAKGIMRDMNLKSDNERVEARRSEEDEKALFSNVMTVEGFARTYAEKLIEVALPAA